MPALLLMLLSASPSFSFAQIATTTGLADALPSTPPGFSAQGIFDCNRIGGASVGSTVATGGPYVPVADAAVELNTGILVYKECVLRNIVNRQRESAMAAITQRTATAIQTGRNGNPQYVVNPDQEIVTNALDPAFAAVLRDGTLNYVNPAFRNAMVRATARAYESDVHGLPGASLECPYRGDLAAWHRGEAPFTFSDLILTTAYSQCNPILAFYDVRDVVIGRTGGAAERLRNEWDWGQGYYAVSDNAADPLQRRILTPPSTVRASFQNVIDSPVRQLESANDIGQMIGALYAGLQTQILADIGGLSGISRSTGGQPSYLDQIVANSSQSLRNTALNAALQILGTARQVEVAYLQAAIGITTALTQASAQLRSAENQCWNLIIPKVCTSALNAQNECTDETSTYKVATSTALYAEAVVVSQITPLVAVAATNTAVSRAALARIDTLIQGVSRSSSLEVQRTSLLELDALVAQRQIHAQPDLDGPNGILKRLESVKGVMNTLVTDTVKAWADDPNAATGWCNINNADVIQAWKDTWRKP